jgi:hypothetical protein
VPNLLMLASGVGVVAATAALWVQGWRRADHRFFASLTSIAVTLSLFSLVAWAATAIAPLPLTLTWVLTQPPQEPPLEQFGVQPVGLCPAMFPRNRYTRGMDHVRLYPARQPEAVAAGFEGQRNPRDLFTGPDRLIPPAVQHRKQPFRARVQLLARLTLNPGKHTGNQPARLAQLDDGNDCAILFQGDEGPAQSLPRRRPGSFGRGIAALHRLTQRRSCHFLAARPIASSGSA